MAILLVAAFVIGAWVLTAWLGRDPRSEAIQWTGVLFAVCLGLTYVGCWAAAIILSRQRRFMVFRALATTTVLFIVVAILEVAAFAGFVNYDLVFRQLRGYGQGPAARFVEDLDFGYRHEANVKWMGKRRGDLAEHFNLPSGPRHLNTFTTDSKGFRNQRELNQADIVLIGDSYVEGFYVSDDETAAVSLEKLASIPVANLGQAGYGSLQELKILRTYGLPLQPKLVAWFFFEGNDLFDDAEFENMSAYLREHGTFENEKPKKRTWASRWNSFMEDSLTRNSFRFTRLIAHPLVPNGVNSFGWFRDANGETHQMYFYDYAALVFGEYEQSRFEITEKALLDAKQACDAQGVRFVLFFIPMKFRVYSAYCTFPEYSPCREWTPWDINQRMADFCRDVGIEFIDLSGPMIEAAGTGRLIYAAEDSHWNADGHQFVAQQVYEAWLKGSS